jgi:hypothetical protein
MLRALFEYEPTEVGDGYIPAFAIVSPPAYRTDHCRNKDRTRGIFVKVHQSRNPLRIKDDEERKDKHRNLIEQV